MFLMKKIAAPLLFPLSIITVLLLFGLFLLWFTRKQKASRRLLTSGVILLLVFSYASLPDFCLGLLEKQYPPLLSVHSADKIRWVVVLGGGHSSDPTLPPTGQISTASLARLLEGIRIHRSYPGSKLLLSGGGVFDPKPEAVTMAELSMVLGIDQSDFILDTLSKDTKDQAKTMKRLIGTDRFVLVTSAAHMPRSMALFRKQGLEPIAAPTDFWVKDAQGFNPRQVYPDAAGLRKMERAVHEFLGIVWAKIRGQI